MNPSQQKVDSLPLEQKKPYDYSNFQGNLYKKSFANPSSNEVQDQFVLDGVDKPSSQIAQQKPRGNEHQSSVLHDYSNHQFFNPNFYSSNFLANNPKQDIKKRISKIDDDLLELIRLNQSPNENISVKKIPSEKEQRNKKALNRLSQQFFGNNLVEPTKQFKASRQTNSTFDMELKNKVQFFKPADLQINHTQTIPHKQSSQPLNSFPQQFFNQRPEKMEIQHQIAPIFQSLQTCQKQNLNGLQSNENAGTHQKDASHGVKFPLELNPIEARLSETKKRRQRVTMDINGLLSMLNSYGQKQKKQIQQMSKKKTRVTMDLQALSNMLSSESTKQEQNPNKLTEKNRRYTQCARPKHERQSVIFQDDGQDEFTPFKNVGSKKIERIEINSKIQMSDRRSHPKIGQPDVEKQVFKWYFQNIQEKLKEGRQRVQNLKQYKANTVKQHRQILGKLKPNPKKLNELKQQQQAIRSQIYQMKQKINKSNFKEYNKVISDIQNCLKVKIHTFKKITKGTINVIKNSINEGFFAEFTYDDMIFRIKRNVGDQVYSCKFQSYTVARKQIFILKLDSTIKFSLYENFLNHRLKRAETFLEVLTKLVNYCKALQAFELSLEYCSQLYDIQEIQINPNTDKLSFKLLTSNKDIFYVFTVSLLDLAQRGGISIQNAFDKTTLQLPESLKQVQHFQKLGKSLVYVTQHCISCIKNDIQENFKFL